MVRTVTVILPNETHTIAGTPPLRAHLTAEFPNQAGPTDLRGKKKMIADHWSKSLICLFVPNLTEV
jgi:hypothetical protein